MSLSTYRRASSPPSVSRGYQNIIEHLKTKVEGSTLHVYSDLDESWTMDTDDITAEVTVPTLTGLSLQGAPQARIHGTVAGSAFKLDISGAADVVVDNVQTDNFSAIVSGAATIEVDGGTAKQASFEISGAGKIRAFSLQAVTLSASISGAGGSEVNATQNLTASISGAGTIKYKGHPSISKDISGVGTLADAN